MHFFSFLAAFLLVVRLKRILKPSPLYLKWKSLLSVATWSIIVIYIITETSFNSIANSFIGSGLLLGLLLFVEKEPDFSTLRSFFKAHYPLVAAGALAGLVRLINFDFYQKWNAVFVATIVGAFIWIFARLATTKKQQEEFKIISLQNAELDRLVAERTAELTQQKNELQDTIALLQTTQQQLIQSEKLASLGELTAGIAHEIQNPLNFVNNFSEVSIELLDEMEQELAKGDKEEATAIAADIKQNLEKIRHHGKRADGIVKGMLQHSRASSNTKEPTDINKLADEYLRLAYHGLRAKDKTFNSELITNFGDNVPALNVVPQDIGRVLLNMFTNAFYAVHEKQKTAGKDYVPTVILSTSADKKHTVIKVRDNGGGIPEGIKDKIMQPFFTTKPTGAGTGLGLSMSYEIVKAHEGDIKVESSEGEYTEFIIILPV